MNDSLRDAIASAIENSVLRVTDGSVRFTDAQLRRIAGEFLGGEVFPDDAQLELSARTFHVTVPEMVVPLAQRRAAPTVEQVWAEHPQLYARHLEALGSEDPHTRKWALVPQPLYSLDTPLGELPKFIIRQCCQGKPCGGTDLYFAPSQGVRDAYYRYVRASNDEGHLATGASTVEALIQQLNDPSWWPNGHDLIGFDAGGRPVRG